MEYLRGTWPEDPAPEGAPNWIIYEYDPDGDAILRQVEIFADGTSLRDSLALRRRDGYPCHSLVDVRFSAFRQTVAFQILPQEDFEQLWRKAKDVPFP